MFHHLKSHWSPQTLGSLIPLPCSEPPWSFGNPGLSEAALLPSPCSDNSRTEPWPCRVAMETGLRVFTIDWYFGGTLWFSVCRDQHNSGWGCPCTIGSFCTLLWGNLSVTEWQRHERNWMGKIFLYSYSFSDYKSNLYSEWKIQWNTEKHTNT